MPDAGENHTTVVLVVDDGREVVVDRLDGRRPDLALVDSLLRLQLAARRRGWRVALRDPGADLRALLELTGLTDVLPPLGGQPRRQAELREQLGVDEVVQPGDPPL